MTLLQDLVGESAAQWPDAPAVRAPDGAVSYRELDDWSNRIARELQRLGVRAGDRVALWSEKGWRLIAAMQACLRLGAIYVPIAADVPAARTATMLEDCGVRALVSDRVRVERVADTHPRLPLLLLDDWASFASHASTPIESPARALDDLVYILYTSGSTGRPKGVCITHQNALAFVRWSAMEARCERESRLANHAAFNFDLSVFDLYAAFLVGACVSVVPESMSTAPAALVKFIRNERISVWYSVPSALMLMAEHGGLLRDRQLALRTVIFAGEVFPIRELRQFRAAWPHVRLLNFYGPTETNVCTAYEVRTIDPARTTPVPIGRACCGDTVWLEDPQGLRTMTEGELIVDGPTVTPGYWGVERRQRSAYATGDICRYDEEGELVYVGRKDHMVKVRGHRVELGEIEAALATHADVRDVAVITMGEGVELRLVAFFVARSEPAPTLLALKHHCARRLPAYMVIHLAFRLPALPRTANGKVDRLRLVEVARDRLVARAQAG